MFRYEYYRASFQCEIIKADLYHNDVECYYTIDPAIGPGFIALKKNKLELWYINIDKTREA
ncbi:MAG: hypothetical protein AB2417_03605 [Clostridiaceae bacterium]